MNSSLKKEVVIALNLEHKAWYFYNYAGDLCRKNAFNNLFKWFKKEAMEELDHANIVSEFLLNLDEDYIYEGLLDNSYTVQNDLNAIENLFVKAAEFETIIKDQYIKIKILADELKDEAVSEFTDKFIHMQTEEIKKFKDHALNARRCKGDQFNMFLFDESFK